MIVALVAAAGVLAMLHAMASAVRYQRQLHERRLKVGRLRRWYEAQEVGTELEPEVLGTVEIIDPCPEDQPHARAA